MNDEWFSIPETKGILFVKRDAIDINALKDAKTGSIIRVHGDVHEAVMWIPSSHTSYDHVAGSISEDV